MILKKGFYFPAPRQFARTLGNFLSWKTFKAFEFFVENSLRELQLPLFSLNQSEFQKIGLNFQKINLIFSLDLLGRGDISPQIRFTELSTLGLPKPREENRNCPERALFGPIGPFWAKRPKPPFHN